MVIAFPGSDIAGSKPELDVLASLLGGKSTIKWAPGYSLLSKATASLSGLSVSASNLAYSDAGLLNIQLTGNAASVRKAAEETVKALKSVADGSVSKDDVTKAIANAKFDALEKGQLRNESIHLAGVGILNGGQPLDAAAVTKSFDSVTADKLKAVSVFSSRSLYYQLLIHFYRLPRLFLRARPPLPPLVTSSFCHTPRKLACEHKRIIRRWSLYQQSTMLDGEISGCAYFVNICSRKSLLSSATFT